MSEGRSRIVDLESRRAAEAPPAEEGPGAPASRRPWILLLLLALLACAAGWALAVGESRELAAALAAQEEALAVQEAALAEAQTRLAAYDTHVGRVHDRVRALAGELGELELLLEAGPGAEGDAGDP